MSNPKKYNYQSHSEVPDILWSYMDSIVDVDYPVRAIEIEDVNKFLNFMESTVLRSDFHLRMAL